MSLPFTDPFDVDTGEWTYGGTCVVAGGILTLNAGTPGGTATAPASTGTWATAAGWHADFEVLTGPPADGTHTVAANFYTADLGTFIAAEWILQGGQLVADFYDSATDTSTEVFTTSHDAEAHRWLRVALDDARSELTWLTSPDGITWTVRASEPYVWTDLEELEVGAFGLSTTTDMEVGEVRVAEGADEPPTFPLDSDTWFRVEITSQHIPDADGDTATSAEVLWEFAEFENVEVKIPKNDARTAKVTVSMFAAELEANDLIDFEHYLRIYYRDQPQPVIWGPLRTDDDYAAGTIEISCVDVLRLQHHYVRRGDPALNNADDPDAGTLSLDWEGIQALVDAAQNTDAQNARGVPELGFQMGSLPGLSDVEFEIQRGDNVWERIQTIAATASGPDFEFAPVDNVPGIYAYLNCFDSQGTNRGREADPDNGILFTYGVDPDLGYPDNLTNVRARRLMPITHAHVLDDNRKHRVTAADEDSSEDYGIYVTWIQSGINIVGEDTTVLEEIAAAHVDAYGRPPHALELELRPDAVQQWFYNEDFYVGDVVSVYATKGFRGVINTHMRIIAVELTQPSKRGPAQTRLAVVPYVARTITDEGA